MVGAKLQKTSGLNKYKEVDFGLSSIPLELAAECGEKESGVAPEKTGTTPLEVVAFAIVAVYLVRFTGVRRKRKDCGVWGTQKGLIVSTPPQEALPTPR